MPAEKETVNSQQSTVNSHHQKLSTPDCLGRHYLVGQLVARLGLGQWLLGGWAAEEVCVELVIFPETCKDIAAGQ